MISLLIAVVLVVVAFRYHENMWPVMPPQNWITLELYYRAHDDWRITVEAQSYDNGNGTWLRCEGPMPCPACSVFRQRMGW